MSSAVADLPRGGPALTALLLTVDARGLAPASQVEERRRCRRVGGAGVEAEVGGPRVRCERHDGQAPQLGRPGLDLGSARALMWTTMLYDCAAAAKKSKAF